MKVTEPDRSTWVKCRTCFALIEPMQVRCPKCRAYQDRRRHLTVMNLVFIGLLVTIIATLMYLVPRLVAWVDPAPNATLRTAFASRGMDFSGQVFITNAGRKELAVHSISISVHDSSDRELTFISTVEDWGEDFIIDGGGVGSKHIPLNRGPGTMKHPITRVVVYHNDGSVQQLLDSSTVVLSNSRKKR